jgi:segregation and condensation protein A
MKKQASASKPAQRKATAASNPEGITEGIVGEGAELHLELPGFEGPFDLLLHLIEEHELDILNIPVAFVTERYLHYLALMQDLNIDIAGDYLVMAATLAHLKSRMLLPTPPADDDADGDEGEQDPRAELIRRLLEYQKYKQAAEQLASRSVLGRDSFTRGALPEIVEGPAPLAPVGVFKLFDAFQKVLERAKIVVDHQIEFERLSITDRINQLVDRLTQLGTLSFDALFDGQWTRPELVVTFLALLEMTRLRLIEVRQAESLGPIMIELAVAEGEPKPEDSAQAEPALDEANGNGHELDAAAPSSPDEAETSGDEAQAAELTALEEAKTSDDEAEAVELTALDVTDVTTDKEVAPAPTALDVMDASGDEAVISEPSILTESAQSIQTDPDAASHEAPEGDGEPLEGSAGPEAQADMDEDIEKGSE